MAVRGFFYNATDLNDKEHMYNGQDMNEDKAPFYKEGVAYGHFRHCGTGKRVYPVQCPGSCHNYGRVRHCGRGKRSI